MTPLIHRFVGYLSLCESGCWEWQGTRDNHGYGRFNIRTKSVMAHRWSYEYFVKKIPDGLYMDHMCRNPRCVNPEHLRAVTPRVNSLENSNGVSAINYAKTHCKNGHKFTEENTYYRNPNIRECRICRKNDRYKYKDKVKRLYIPVAEAESLKTDLLRPNRKRSVLDTDEEWARAVGFNEGKQFVAGALEALVEKHR